MKLPSFIICGAPKAGTTSIYNYLNQHPEVCMSIPKETGFFFENYEKGIEWFSETYFNHSNDQKAIGEASAGNMLHKNVAERIYSHIPEAKIIMILRDPVDRLFSHFNFDIGIGHLPPNSSFSTFICNEENNWRQIMLDLGMYYKQIKRYMHFFPTDQIKIYFYEELKEKPEWLIRDLYQFIGVDISFKPNLIRQHNVTIYPSPIYKILYPLWHFLKKTSSASLLKLTYKYREKLRKEIFKGKKQDLIVKDKEYLSTIYSESNKKLSQLLNKDLSHWK